MIRFTDLKLPGLKATSVDGELGDSYVMDIQDGYDRSTSPYVTLTAKGAVDETAERVAGSRRIKAGLTNVGGMLFTPNAGQITRTVVTPKYRYYCLSDPARRKLEAQEVRLTSGQSFTVQPGYFLFVGIGVVSAVGKERVAPAFMEAVTDPCIVTAGADGALAICIQRLPPP